MLVSERDQKVEWRGNVEFGNAYSDGSNRRRRRGCRLRNARAIKSRSRKSGGNNGVAIIARKCNELITIGDGHCRAQALQRRGADS